MLSTLSDRYWKRISLDEGIDVMKNCIAEVQKRLVISNRHFCIKMVTKDGISIITKADTDTPTESKPTADMVMDTASPSATAAALLTSKNIIKDILYKK